MFPSTAEGAAGVGSPNAFPVGSQNDPGFLAVWGEHAGGLTPGAVSRSLEGREFDVVDLASLKARLISYEVAALTGDPGSSLTIGSQEDSIYNSMDDGSHVSVSEVGFVDGEGVHLLTGTLENGETFQVYLWITAEPIDP